MDANNHQGEKGSEKDMGKPSVWLGEDGIIRIKTNKMMDEAILMKVVRDYRETAKKLPSKTSVLIDIRDSLPTPSYIFRKATADVLVNTYKDPGFTKMALWGGGTVIKVVGLFIIAATGLTNIKNFTTEKEAIDWIKS